MHTSVEESMGMECFSKWLLVSSWTCDECVTAGERRNQSMMLSEFGIVRLLELEWNNKTWLSQTRDDIPQTATFT
mgnify:CR=1 FL=1